MIDRFRHASSLTAAVRVFIVNSYGAAATEDGHANIGHAPALADLFGNQGAGTKSFVDRSAICLGVRKSLVYDTAGTGGYLNDL